eukprot:TRINITY_DN26328_c0_g5_i1.p1 TRINITY_DN26328_c0_g5~~TRINITY_DN26328_c0_g5_i1.p1  ORF type:complete len:144 (+),score=19.36 TRINITY_DN26328_c0_g5_i1:164-595(+)
MASAHDSHASLMARQVQFYALERETVDAMLLSLTSFVAMIVFIFMLDRYFRLGQNAMPVNKKLASDMETGARVEDEARVGDSTTWLGGYFRDENVRARDLDVAGEMQSVTRCHKDASWRKGYLRPHVLLGRHSVQNIGDILKR